LGILFQLNEGTNYAQSVRTLNLSSNKEEAAFDNYISRLVIDNSTLTSGILADIRKHYPANDLTAGGPFHTGDSLYDRAASWYTDEMYLAPRRLFFDKAAMFQPLFGYYFIEFMAGNDPSRGGRPTFRVTHLTLSSNLESSCSEPCLRATLVIWTCTRG
jgi:hypothetical protein